MKKTLIIYFLSMIGVLSIIGNLTAAEWKLYDNFDNYTSINDLNMNKWAVCYNFGSITIENGQVRFECPPHLPNFGTWLMLQKNPIKGIRAKVRVAAWTGNVEAIIFSDLGHGKNDGYMVRSKLRIHHMEGIETPVIKGLIKAVDQNNSYDWIYDYHNTAFGYNVIPALNETYTLTMILSRTKVTYIVKGNVNGKWGKMTYVFPKKLEPNDGYLRYIGIESEDDDGSGVVYFDDVYVLKP